MTIGVLLDVNIVLDLLLKRGPNYNDKAVLFATLRQKECPLFFAACALPSLEYIHAKEIKRLADDGLIKSNIPPRDLARRQLSRFLEAINIAPTLGAHWRRIPEDHPDREDALISLSSAELPGATFIWTNDEDFYPAVSGIAFGDDLALQEYIENKAQGNIAFVDLGYQQGIVREHLEERIFRVLKHGLYIMGPEVKELEQKLASYVDIKHAISCASGTDALLMALMAYGVGPGDAIFTTPFTFIATAEVISLLGATPVFVDIDPKTYNIDPAKLEKAIIAIKSNDPSSHPLPLNSVLSPQHSALSPKGVIPVDLFGLPADYDTINAIARPVFSQKVVITGDVMADALEFAATRATTHSNILSRLELQPQGYLLATVHRAENTDDNQILQNILTAFAALNELVVFPAHPRTRKFLQETGYQPPKNVKLIDPVGYFDVIALEKSARFLLTDSGGMQKEAYWLKVPCITLRDETEWVETVEAGWNILTGADRDRIIEAVQTFKAPSEHRPLYGDGQAAAHCLKALLKS